MCVYVCVCGVCVCVCSFVLVLIGTYGIKPACLLDIRSMKVKDNLFIAIVLLVAGM